MRILKEEKVLKIFEENQTGFHHPPTHDLSPDEGEPRNDFWSISGNYSYRHHVESRARLYVPREESFPILLKYIDVTRSKHTDLDVQQGKRIDDCWTSIRTEIYQMRGQDSHGSPTILNVKPPDGYTWSGERLTKRQATSRPDHLWPEIW